MSAALVQSPLFAIRRPDSADDWPFIDVTLRESYSHESPVTVNIPKSVFHVEHKRRLAECIQRPTNDVLLACLPDDPATLMGFLVFDLEIDEKPVIHYIFVKFAFRHMGIAQALLASANIDPNDATCTHWTYWVSQHKSWWPKMVYNPYLF